MAAESFIEKDLEALLDVTSHVGDSTSIGSGLPRVVKPGILCDGMSRLSTRAETERGSFIFSSLKMRFCNLTDEMFCFAEIFVVFTYHLLEKLENSLNSIWIDLLSGHGT